MSESHWREARDLPTLPDWPPLRDDPSQAVWPPLDPWAPDESHPADALQPTERDDRLRSPRTPAAVPPGRSGIRRRLRGASKRVRLGITVAIVVLVVLIVACSAFALRTTNGLVTGSAPDGAVATQTAGHTRTPHALPTVTPLPTSQPTPTATATSPTQLTLTFTCASGSIHGTGQVCVQTQPGASLSLAVRYCDGSTAKGLHDGATADGSGNYTWTWLVRTSCAGPATAAVTANWNGQSLTQSDTFTIAK